MASQNVGFLSNVLQNNASCAQPSPHSNSAAGPSSGSDPTPTDNEDSAAENELLKLINQNRDAAGIPLLRMDESLREAALAHAERMVSNQRLDHQFSGEPSLLERVAQASDLKTDRAGENIVSSKCASTAHDALMRSAPHRANILDRSFNVAGVAAIWSKGRLYVVQVFAHELPSYSARESEELVSEAVDEIRLQAGLSELTQLTPSHLDKAACSLARENHPSARLLATAYVDRNNDDGQIETRLLFNQVLDGQMIDPRKLDSRKIVTYAASRPDALPPGALRLLREPAIRQFAVGSCYARNAAYPTGMYWVAIFLY